MDMKKICQNQSHEIEKYKWIKGQEIRRDPGEEAAREWIAKYAAQYRKEYEETFNVYVKETMDKTVEEIQKIHPDLSTNEVAVVIRTVIESFTDIWCHDMCMCKNKKHLDEI